MGGDNDFQTKISWGSQARYGKKLNVFNGSKLSQNIKNFKFNNNNLDWMSDMNSFIIESKKTWYSGAYWLEYSQSVGLTFYWENDTWYLQVLIRQYGNSGGGSGIGGEHQTYIGKGIRLYND